MDLVLYSVTTYGTEAGFQLLISFWTHRCSRTTNNSFTVINDTRMKGISIFYYSVYVFTVLHVLFLLIYLRKEKKKERKVLFEPLGLPRWILIDTTRFYCGTDVYNCIISSPIYVCLKRLNKNRISDIIIFGQVTRCPLPPLLHDRISNIVTLLLLC